MKYFLLLFMPVFFVAQNIIDVKFETGLSDPKKKTRSLEIIDIRSNKELGEITVKNEIYKLSTAKDLKSLLEDNFNESNKSTTDGNEIVVLIEKLDISQDSLKPVNTNLNIKIASFYKRANYYSLINRMEGVFPNEINNRVGPVKTLAQRIEGLVSSFIVSSYGAVAINYPLQHSDLLNYEEKIVSSYIINKNEVKVTGVYTDFSSFLKQVPSTKYSIKTNKNGEFTSVKEGDYNVSSSYFYAVIHDNTVYKSTLAGLKKVSKDSKGMFMLTSYNRMFKTKTGSTGAIVGGLMGGLVGGVVGGMLDVAFASPSDIYGDLITSKVYLDPITYGYTLK